MIFVLYLDLLIIKTRANNFSGHRAVYVISLNFLSSFYAIAQPSLNRTQHQFPPDRLIKPNKVFLYLPPPQRKSSTFSPLQFQLNEQQPFNYSTNTTKSSKISNWNHHDNIPCIWKLPSFADNKNLNSSSHLKKELSLVLELLLLL